MNISAVEPRGLAGERRAPHLRGVLLGICALALVAAEIATLPDPALPWVLAAALLLGAGFILLGYGFTADFRALLAAGDGRAVGASFIVPAVAALVIIPVGRLVAGYGRFVAPVGVSLAPGASMFGVGMQLANGCGSGALVSSGQGSRRMWVALPFFCLGGLLAA